MKPKTSRIDKSKYTTNYNTALDRETKEYLDKIINALDDKYGLT